MICAEFRNLYLFLVVAVSTTSAPLPVTTAAEPPAVPQKSVDQRHADTSTVSTRDGVSEQRRSSFSTTSSSSSLGGYVSKTTLKSGEIWVLQ